MMIRGLTFKFVFVAAAAAVISAQNYPPGTRCFTMTEETASERCKHPGTNNPPTVVFRVNAEDKRAMELCAQEMLSAAECSAVVGNVRLAAVAFDPDGDSLYHTYATTGGRITGDGAQAFWNMNSAVSGTYTATVEIDDGCGCVAFASLNLAVKHPAPKWLNGIWEGTRYQFDIDEAWTMKFSAADDNYTIDYQSQKCGGKWLLLEAAGDTASFKEEITAGTENCSHGDTIRIKKLQSGELGAAYIHSGQRNVIAATILKATKATKKPVRPKKTRKPAARSKQ